MKKETSDFKLRRPEYEASVNDPLPTYDLPVLIEQMKHSQSWKKGQLKAMILFKRSDKQIVLTALHKETKISPSQSNKLITFHVIEGKIMFHTPKQSRTLEKGQLLTLHQKIKYSMTTTEETVLLISSATASLQPEVY
jgi:hypothetical protein